MDKGRTLLVIGGIAAVFGGLIMLINTFRGIVNIISIMLSYGVSAVSIPWGWYFFGFLVSVLVLATGIFALIGSGKVSMAKLLRILGGASAVLSLFQVFRASVSIINFFSLPYSLLDAGALFLSFLLPLISFVVAFFASLLILIGAILNNRAHQRQFPQ
ncbi:MAG: hypothetical protein FWF91_05895 [Coriobacteriia bacterium]|nr:hypothetical protein [Coriobacteriia bacterium]